MSIALLALTLGSAAAQVGYGLSTRITDDRGQVVTLTQPPRRIVSLLPSLTEAVCALGQCERLVGVDRYSNYPAGVRLLPVLGGGLDPDIEAVVALKPDLVLVATSSRASARLETLGIAVVALEPKNHADVQRVLGQLGQLLAVPDAQRIWRDMDSALSAVARSLPVNAKAARVYFEVNDAPYAAGEASFIGETLTRLGIKNIVPASLGPFPKLNPEFVVRADPDVIMVGERGVTALAGRPGWGSLRAVREQRVCMFDTSESDAMVRAGPRLVEGARAMARCLLEKSP